MSQSQQQQQQLAQAQFQAFGNSLSNLQQQHQHHQQQQQQQQQHQQHTSIHHQQHLQQQQQTAQQQSLTAAAAAVAAANSGHHHHQQQQQQQRHTLWRAKSKRCARAPTLCREETELTHISTSKPAGAGSAVLFVFFSMYSRVNTQNSRGWKASEFFYRSRATCVYGSPFEGSNSSSSSSSSSRRKHFSHDLNKPRLELEKQQQMGWLSGRDGHIQTTVWEMHSNTSTSQEVLLLWKTGHTHRDPLEQVFIKYV
ncbi:basic-leucine zipper transcription factor A-like [Wyeomyia smithii]|uniref:basic-leucine zipper transcription factor A-like n=1 Tax=Wyeomyia smithii TaxID=174621 RepID=UPI002467ED19|nr:basic-leucine zipper transcription factor A-like [Wyeomyia smithii]